MVPNIPGYITAIVLVTALAVVAAVWGLFASATARSGLAPGEQRRVLWGIGLFLGLWLGAALVLAPAPESLLSRDRFYLTPLIPFFATASIAIALVTLWRSTAFRRVLDAASLPAMIGIQVYRTIGAVFVVLLAQGQLPAHFALPAGWGDVAVGVLAPFVALALARRASGARALALGWNVVGLLDLIVAVGMGTGFLAPVLQPELGSRVPPAAAMGVFPMVIVPTVVVPISVLLHVLAIRGLLRREARVGSHWAPQPVR